VKTAPTDSAMNIAWRGFFAIFPVILVATVATIAFGYLSLNMKMPGFVSALIDAAITACVAFAAHNYILNGESHRGFGAMRSNTSRAFLTFMLLSFLVVSLMHLLGSAIALMQTPFDPEASRFPTEGELLRGVAISFGLFALIVLIMCAFGTIFPAIVDGGDTSLRAAWQRKTTWKIFVRLLGVMVVAIALLLLVSFVTFPLMRSGAEVLYAGGWSWQLTVAGTITTILNFFLTTLVAVIFSKAYLGSYAKVSE